MGNNLPPNSSDLRAELDRLSTVLAEKESELCRTLERAETAAVDAIITGKPSKAPALRSKAGEIDAELKELRSQTKEVTAALQRVESLEADAAGLAEKKLAQELHAERRTEVGSLIAAIQKPSKFAADRACSRLAALHFRFPAKLRPAPVTAGGVVREEQLWTLDARISLLESICNAGFSDLLDVGHPARARYEDRKHFEESDSKRREAERAHRASVANASIIDETQTDQVLKDRRKSMNYR